MICKEKECGNKVKARGWCNKHYQRWLAHGNPNINMNHGYSNHPLYQAWVHMKNRCYNKNYKQYKDWGGRGIRVCDEWKDNKDVFIKWGLDNGWKKGLYFDRKDNDGNYAPENCRFITYTESIHNQRLLISTNTSGYRGASLQNKKWIVNININGRRKYLGRFSSLRLAALRYDVEAYLTDNRPRNLF